MLVKKKPISAENKKITLSKSQILAQDFFPEWFGPKQIEGEILSMS